MLTCFVGKGYMVKKFPLRPGRQSGLRQSRILCVLSKENAYKILYFWYLTTDVLHVIYPSSSNQCWHCQGYKGTLFHIYWDGLLIAPFWHPTQQLLTRLVKVPVPMTPKFFQLGLSPLKIAKPYRKLLKHPYSRMLPCCAQLEEALSTFARCPVC